MGFRQKAAQGGDNLEWRGSEHGDVLALAICHFSTPSFVHKAFSSRYGIPDIGNPGEEEICNKGVTGRIVCALF